MHIEIAFDSRLREKANILRGKDAEKHYRVQKLCLSRLKNVTIVLYYFVVPYFETPDWCLDYFQSDETPPVEGIFVECEQAENGIIKYSGMPKLIPPVCSSIDLTCLLCLCIFRCYKQTWRRLTRNEKIRNWIFFTIQLLCSADVIRAAITYSYPYVNNLCRPWVCIIFFSSIRQNLKSVAYDFKDSIVVLACIFMYIAYFSAIGFFLVEGTFQQFSDFDTFGNTYFSLVILITTSNFPDIMLPAYNTSTWYTLYFILFVIFGVFFLMNVLLAVIFDNYKRRIGWTTETRSRERMKYIN